MKGTIPYLEEWLELSKSGNFDKAQEIYFEKLFSSVIDVFCESNKAILPKHGILFSMLGYSPEPIILTAKLIEPELHVIFTTNKKSEGNDYLEKYLDTEYETVILQTETFSSIYRALKEQLLLNPSSNVTLDITGGKKSMVASAAIFGKDYGCRIVYVDFKEYIKDLRKPMPGSEVVNVVYDPNINQPEMFIL